MSEEMRIYLASEGAVAIGCSESPAAYLAGGAAGVHPGWPAVLPGVQQQHLRAIHSVRLKHAKEKHIYKILYIIQYNIIEIIIPCPFSSFFIEDIVSVVLLRNHRT